MACASETGDWCHCGDEVRCPRKVEATWRPFNDDGGFHGLKIRGLQTAVEVHSNAHNRSDERSASRGRTNFVRPRVRVEVGDAAGTA